MSTVRIFFPDGQAPFTDRVELSNVANHIEADDRLADEAVLLRAFYDADEIPESLLSEWVRSREGGTTSEPWVEYSRQTRSMIGCMTVTSGFPFIVYGDVRGLVSGHLSRSDAFDALQRDSDGCAKQGGYSDACVYMASDGLWVRCFDADDDDDEPSESKRPAGSMTCEDCGADGARLFCRWPAWLCVACGNQRKAAGGVNHG